MYRLAAQAAAVQACLRRSRVGSEATPGAGPRGAKDGLMAGTLPGAPSRGERHVHHRLPRCLLKVYDRAQGPGLEPEDLQAWFDWQEEAFRYRVDPDLSREDLAALIDGSSVEIAGEEHRAGHSQAGDFARWGRLGGLETLRRYGRPWFALLGRRRWGRVGVDELARYRADFVAKAGGQT